MGKKTGSYIKSMKKVHERIKKKKEEIENLEQELLVLYKNEKQFWVKQNTCTICGCEDSKTKWKGVSHLCKK